MNLASRRRVTGSTGSPRTGPGSPRGARSTKERAPSAGCKAIHIFSLS